MTDPVPSKERIAELIAEQERMSSFLASANHPDFDSMLARAADTIAALKDIERLRREDHRWVNAHKILLADIERHKRDVKLLEIVGKEQEQRIAELKRPAHEREPPHCSTCACGLTPEPPVCRCIPLADRPWKFCQDCGGLTQPPGAGQ